MDNFFGIPTLVGFLIGGGAFARTLTYDAAYGPLLTKIGMRPAASSGAASEA